MSHPLGPEPRITSRPLTPPVEALPMNGLRADATHTLAGNLLSKGATTSHAGLNGTINGTAHTAPLQMLKAPHVSAQKDTGLFKKVTTDLSSIGIGIRRLLFETSRGIASEALRWTSSLCLLGFGLQAATEQSPLTLAFVAAWATCSSLASWCDRVWRTRVNEFDRSYGRVLDARLIRTQGQASLKALDDVDHQAALELHHQRREGLSNLVETSVAFPSYLIRLALSGGVLLAADWRIGVALALAVAPGIFVKTKHTREDVQLEEKQSRQRKLVDTITDEAYSPSGSIRMILGRFTDRVARTINSLQSTVDSEKNAHERRQAALATISDGVFFGVLGVSMYLLYNQYTLGSIGIGALGFLWLQLIDLGTELDDQGDTMQEYVELREKVKRFYEFTEPHAELNRVAFPMDYTIHLNDARFVRGDDDTSFAVSSPTCSLSPGSLLIIHGANGAGKTTLQRHLAFAEEPASGEYRIGDVPAHRIQSSEWRKALGYCGATPSLLRGLTIREALSRDPEGEAFLQERIAHPLIKELVEDLEGKDGLETRIGMGLPKGREFSSGELQRLMVVTALVPRRKLLFIDEVTSNQSDSFITTLAEELRRQREQGTTVIFVTHSKRFDADASHIMQVSRGVGELERAPLDVERHRAHVGGSFGVDDVDIGIASAMARSAPPPNDGNNGALTH